MEFNIPPGNQPKMQADILLEILAWQSVIVDKMVTKEAIDESKSFDGVMEDWLQKKEDAKAAYRNEVYGNHGPDPSAELGL